VEENSNPFDRKLIFDFRRDEMTPEQKRLVQNSFEQVAPIAEVAAGLFYDRLFELNPALRPLFKGDLGEQGRKLMQMIGTVVKGLDRFDELIPAAQALGKRHVGYGVRDEDYETVGAALLWTLGKGLGAAFTQEVKEAWTAAYGAITTAMKSAIAPLKAAAPLPVQVGSAMSWAGPRPCSSADPVIVISRRKEVSLVLERVG
jgi:hemoglobin-like flavoprotein